MKKEEGLIDFFEVLTQEAVNKYNGRNDVYFVSNPKPEEKELIPNRDKGVYVLSIDKCFDDEGNIVDRKDIDKTKKERIANKKAILLNDISTKAKEFINSDNSKIDIPVEKTAKKSNSSCILCIKEENFNTLTGYYSILEEGETIEWNDEDGNVITLTKDTTKTLLKRLKKIYNNIWNVQWISYKTAIEKATTLEQLEAISIEYKIVEE